MATWMELEPELVPLTPEQARIHSERPHLDGDRDRDSTNGKRRIEWLRGHLEEGQFMTPTWAIAELQGQWYRVDGGHSSKMLAECNGIFPQGKRVLLRKFQCNTDRDLADLFDIFDNRKSLRTLNDKIKAHRSIHDNLVTLAPSTIGKLLSGIVLTIHKKVVKIDEEDRVGLIHEHRDFISWAGEVYNSSIANVGFLACMFRAYGISEVHAGQFAIAVRDGTAPKPTDATRTLQDFLKSLRIETERRRWDSRACYVKSIHAWNAWMQGETTQLKYHADAPIPRMLCEQDGRLVSFG